MIENITVAADDLLEYDEVALIELLGIRAKAMQRDLSIAGELSPKVKYDATYLGPLEEVKALGSRILRRWNKELFHIVRGTSKDDEVDRKNILNALTLGEGAAIAALIPILTALGLAPTLAAVVAAIVVKRFLGSAVETICDTWKQQEAMDRE